MGRMGWEQGEVRGKLGRPGSQEKTLAEENML